MDAATIRALTIDVFGTVADWRSSLIRAEEAFGRVRGLGAGRATLAGAWRDLHQPTLERARA